MTNYAYVGSELELFSYAFNWKAYYSSIISPYFGDEVLEVGAGIGSTTKILCQGDKTRWVCLEPDPVMADKLNSLLASGELPKFCEVKTGNLSSLSYNEKFDTIIYIDVLEHIKDDRAEIKMAASCLKKEGVLVVLSPAHQWLFTPFDRAIGHYRRYNKKTLSAIVPQNFDCVKIIYLDSISIIISLLNRFFFKSKIPTLKQIKIWDTQIVVWSAKIDAILRYSIGKTIVGIWKKNN